MEEGPPSSTHWRPRLLRWLQFALDGTALGVAFGLAYLLRFEFLIPPEQARNALAQLPLFLGVQFATMVACGCYDFVWRYVSLRETGAFARAMAIAAALLFALRLGLPEAFSVWRIPISVIVLGAVLGFGAVVGLRVLRRVTWEESERGRKRVATESGRPPAVLLIGAGQAGRLAVREIDARGQRELDIKGFVDDDPAKQGAIVHGVKVLGTSRDLPRLVRELAIDHVIVTIAEPKPDRMKQLLEICESIPVRVRTIPGFFEILQGRVTVNRFRDIAVEELLGRAPVRLDEQELAQFLADQSVLVTGAGGSIGSELARQVARFSPKRLVLVERAENALFEIDRELRALRPQLELAPVLADVGDRERMRATLAEYRPALVAHAAAHKHVPMVEANPAEAVKNNVFGTLTLGELAGEYGVGTFVLVSTDKAVHPTSVMGASKRLAELVVQDLAQRLPTHYLAVRFGNVMGSAGSVIPIFREQIARGGPVTVTHPEMQRYFMTIPEAVQLVLQAATLGERGEIFVLDMGEPVRILDLAERMIELSGFEPHRDIRIVFSGVRPGEKLFEEIELSGEAMAKTRHPKIFNGHLQPADPRELQACLAELQRAASVGDREEIRRVLNDFLPEARLGELLAGVEAASP